MDYQYDYRVEACDLWKLSMYGIYHSMAGVSNVILTVALLLLAVKLRGQAGIVAEGLLIVAALSFILIQPLAIYGKAKKRTDAMPDQLQIAFDEKGIHVKSNERCSDIKWQSVKAVVKRSGMIIVFSTAAQGFILSNRMLGNQKEEVFQYLTAKVVHS